MWSSTNIASMLRSLRLWRFASALSIIFMANFCWAQAGLRAPATVIAGNDASLATTGSGSATLFLVGPSSATKRTVQLGESQTISGDELRNAGRYLAILCSESCQSASFFVTAAAPADLSLLAHPSRVPVDRPDAISGAAFVFDKFGNLALSPTTVDFQMLNGNTEAMSRKVPAHDGVAWFRVNSGKHAGPVQLIAAAGGHSTTQIVRQVASDPCNLRIAAQSTAKSIVVETQPVRDCSGNPVPDGTIVTFTRRGSDGLSTVDAPIKKGIARAEMTPTNAAVITAASGVVMGNEIRIGGQ
jgi:hypothetical protein